MSENKEQLKHIDYVNHQLHFALSELNILRGRVKELEDIMEKSRKFVDKVTHVMPKIVEVTSFAYTFGYMWPVGVKWNIVNEKKALQDAIDKYDESTN